MAVPDVELSHQAAGKKYKNSPRSAPQFKQTSALLQELETQRSEQVIQQCYCVLVSIFLIRPIERGTDLSVVTSSAVASGHQ
jgi:hypothetical protein